MAEEKSVPAPKPVPVPVKAEQLPVEEKEKGELLEKIGKILKEHDGLESNVPLDHEYWGLLNRYRAFR